MERVIEVMDRMLTTSPVHPTSAADMIFSAMVKAFCLSLCIDMGPGLRLSGIGISVEVILSNQRRLK